MRQDTIIIHRSDDPFARVPKAVLDDEQLTWKAKGILAYLLGKPKDWQTQTTDLVRRSPDGKHAVLSGLKELIIHGYAKRELVRAGGGKITGCNTYVSDTPIFLKKSPQPDFQHAAPQPDFPHPGNQYPGNQPLTKTDFNSERGRTKNEPLPSPSVSEEDATLFADAYEHAYRLTTGNPYQMTSSTRRKVAKWFADNPGFPVPKLIQSAIDMWMIDTSVNPKAYYYTLKNLTSPMGFLTTYNEIANELDHSRPHFRFSSTVMRIAERVFSGLRGSGS